MSHKLAREIDGVMMKRYIISTETNEITEDAEGPFVKLEDIRDRMKYHQSLLYKKCYEFEDDMIDAIFSEFGVNE